MRKPNSGPHESQPFFYSLKESPIGLIGLVATSQGLCEIKTRVKNEDSFKKYLAQSYPSPVTRQPGPFKQVSKQLDQFFKGTPVKFTCKLDLNQGTEFQQKVWKALNAIPYGQTRSYLWIARKVGKPKASRAIGQANSKNPIPIIVPCHRVIRESGELGGYTGGLDAKRLLLKLEQTGAPV